MKYLNLFESFDTKKDDVSYIEQMLYDIDEYGYNFEVYDTSYSYIRVQISNYSAVDQKEPSDNPNTVEWDIVKDKMCQVISVLNNYQIVDILFRTTLISSKTSIYPWIRLSDVINEQPLKAHYTLPRTPDKFKPIDIENTKLDVNKFLPYVHCSYCIHDPGMNEWLDDFYYQGKIKDIHNFKSGHQFDDTKIEIDDSDVNSDVLPKISAFAFALKKNI